jgi:hypothetical protein
MLALLCFAAVTTVMTTQAQTPRVGVSVGDTFRYDYIVTYSSMYGDPVPDELIPENQTAWVDMTVTKISGTIITFDMKTRYRDGTEIANVTTCDIDTGETSLGGPPFIDANLNKGDMINPGADTAWYINQTETRDYKDSARETNQLQFQDSAVFEEIGDFLSVLDYWFDRATGAPVEYTSAVAYGGIIIARESKLISTNIWEVGDVQTGTNPPGGIQFNMPAVAGLITAVVIIIGIVLVIRRRNIKATTPPPAPKNQK